MQVWVGIVIAIAVAAIYICVEIYKELHHFRTIIYQIETDKLKKTDGTLKVAFLSDLHNHEYGVENEELLDAIRSVSPDYIIAGGDMLVGRKGRHSLTVAETFMKKLVEIAPVYAANGNHEQRMHEFPERYEYAYEDYKECLEDAGVKWLINERVMVKWGESKLEISGIELPMDCYRRPRKKWLQLEDVESRMGVCNKECYQILLAHHPDYAKVYREWGADLTLSGHLHGGVARLPILGGVISPQAGLFPKYSGDCYEVDGGNIVVSKGLGTHTINIRFWNPAELIVLHINGKM